LAGDTDAAGFREWQESHVHSIIRDALKIVESATQAEPIQIDSEMVTGPTVATLDRPLQGRRDFRGGQPRFEWYAAPIADLRQFGAGSSRALPGDVIHDEDPLMSHPDLASLDLALT
jgi:hypothetical protein